MWSAVKHKEIVVVLGFQRLFHGSEAFNGNARLHLLLEAPHMPIEARALGNIEVGDLYVPSGLGILARDEPRARGFPHPALLRYDCDYDCHCIDPGTLIAERRNSVK
jgi:hypothetical protein